MLLEDLLGAAGYQIVLAETLSTAMALAQAEMIDVAILDVMLGRDHSFPLADAVHERCVPFLFASATVVTVSRNGSTGRRCCRNRTT